MSYQDFIASKRHTLSSYGFDPVWMPDCAFDFQLPHKEMVLVKA